MTFRERIADWISGGALSDARDEISGWRGACAKAWDSNVELHATLDRIASLETPRCAHIGKRMARIARGEE